MANEILNSGRPAENDQSETAAATPNRAAELVDLRNYRPKESLSILVVDDDVADFKLFERTLGKIGELKVTKVWARSSDEAVDQLDRFPFDIAFIDNRLSAASGLDVVRQAGGRLARTPMVIITGHYDKGAEDEAMRAGAFDYLDKAAISADLLRRVIRYVSAQHEITRRLVAAEQRSRDLVELANEANDAKSRFLAQMSHELRTPLNAILGFAEIIRDQVLGHARVDRYSEYARDIHTSGSQLLNLINDLLDLAKVEAGEFSIVFEDVAPAEALSTAVAGVRPLIEQKRLHATMEIEPALPPVLADPARLQQMLANLLANAIKFTPDGGAITASARRVGDDVVLSVTDTGVGMPADALDDVAQPFVQLDNPLQQPGDGTGLGLALVKSLIERHGGTLSINSREGEGSCVALSFPVGNTPAPAG